MSNSSYAANLIVAGQLYSSYSTYIILGFGFIGTLLNILVFTNLTIFRGNRCAFYLIAECVVDIAQLTHMAFNEIWKGAINGIEPVNISVEWCKTKTMIGQWCRFMLALIVCFAAFDQFLSTHPFVYLRQLSSLKLAQRQICVSICLCLLHTIPFVVYLGIRSPSGCIVTNTILQNYYSFFYYPVLNGLLPSFVASLFSLLAYRNVRRIISRHIPIDRRRLDQQLTAMIFVRVISYVILSIPYATYRIYSLNVVVNRTDAIGYAVNQSIYLITISFIYVNHAVNFYVFYATSTRYRRQVKYFLMKKCWQSLRQCCRRRQNVIRPVGRTSTATDSEPE